MKSQKQTKLLFGFALSMMDKAIEMQNAKNKFQELKNEEIRLQSTQIKGEILELKSPFNEDEPIDEKLKSEVENDPLFKLFDDIFNPNKNKEIIDEIMTKDFLRAEFWWELVRKDQTAKKTIAIVQRMY